MATDTTKITGAADELSAGLAKGGTAAKTLGVEIANAIKSLDGRVAALEAGGGTEPPIEPPIEPPSSNVIPIEGFSGANNASFKIAGLQCEVQNANKSYSLTSPDNVTLRFELRSGEEWNGTERSEIYIQKVWPWGTAIQIDYDFMLDAGTRSTGGWTCLGQFHDHPDSGASPPYELDLHPGDKMTILLGATATLGPGCTGQFKYNGQNYGYPYKDPNSLQRGKWYQLRIQVKFSNNSTGYLKVWRDGTQIVNYSGPIGYNFGTGVYWKNGIYRADAAETLAIRYRNLIISPR